MKANMLFLFLFLFSFCCFSQSKNKIDLTQLKAAGAPDVFFQEGNCNFTILHWANPGVFKLKLITADTATNDSLWKLAVKWPNPYLYFTLDTTEKPNKTIGKVLFYYEDVQVYNHQGGTSGEAPQTGYAYLNLKCYDEKMARQSELRKKKIIRYAVIIAILAGTKTWLGL
jgi:hypothetical protein